MTKFYTGKGDKGESDLGGKKVSKSSEYAEAVGSLDEINTWLGYAGSVIEDDFISSTLRKIQEALFIGQAEVGALGAGHKPNKVMAGDKVKMLEDAVERIDKEVPEITHFVIPGGSKESAMLDFGRTLARKTERRVVAFHNKDTEVSDGLLQFINRLSSTLFAMARYINYKKGVDEDCPSYS